MPTLSSLLVSRGVASMRAVEDAIARQVLYGGDLATNLLEVADVSEHELGLAVAESLGMQPATSGRLLATPAIARILPRDLAIRHAVFPLARDGSRLLVATTQPLGTAVEADLSAALGLEIRALSALSIRVRQALLDFYDAPLDRRSMKLLARLEGHAEPSLDSAPPPTRNEAPVRLPRPASIPAPTFGTGLPATSVSASIDALYASFGAGPWPVGRESAEPSPLDPKRRVAPTVKEGTIDLDALDPLGAGDGEAATARSREPSAAPAAPATPPGDAASAEVTAPAAPSPGVRARALRALRASRIVAPPRRHKGPLTLAQVEEQLSRAESGDRALELFFGFSAQFFEYSALFAVHGELAEGRDAHGPGADAVKVAGIGVPLDLPSSLERARKRASPLVAPLASDGVDRELARDLGRDEHASVRTRNVAFVPLVLRGKTVAILYGDDGAASVELSLIGDVIACAGLTATALEALILKKKSGRSLAAIPAPAPAKPADRPSSVGVRDAGLRALASVVVPEAPREASQPAPSAERGLETTGDVGAMASDERAPHEGAEHVHAHAEQGPAREQPERDGAHEQAAHDGTRERRITEPFALDSWAPPPSPEPPEASPPAGLALRPSSSAKSVPVPAFVESAHDDGPGPRSAASIDDALRGVVERAPPVPPRASRSERSRTEPQTELLGEDAVASPAFEGHAARQPIRRRQRTLPGMPAIAPLEVPAEPVKSFEPTPPPDDEPSAALIDEPTLDAADDVPAPLEHVAHAEHVEHVERVEHAGTARLDAAPTTAAPPVAVDAPSPRAASHAPPSADVGPSPRASSDRPPPEPTILALRRPHGRPLPREEEPEPEPISTSDASHLVAREARGSARPPPPESVYPKTAEEVAGLLRLVLGEGPDARRALEELVIEGEAVLPLAMAGFPGPLKVDRHRARDLLPPASQCGPLLELLVALGKLALPHVTVRTSSSDVELRFWAAHVLGELRFAGAASALLPRLFDDDASVRRIARRSAAALVSAGALGAPIAQGLDDMTRDQAEPIARRRLAIETMAEIRDPSMAVPLMAVLDDPSEDVAEAARKALLAITRQDFGRDTRRWAEWWQEHAGRHRIEWLIDALMHDLPSMRRAAGEELKQLTKEYFGYYDDLPKRERERAQARYREWWQREGRARHGG